MTTINTRRLSFAWRVGNVVGIAVWIATAVYVNTLDMGDALGRVLFSVLFGGIFFWSARGVTFFLLCNLIARDIGQFIERDESRRVVDEVEVTTKFRLSGDERLDVYIERFVAARKMLLYAVMWILVAIFYIGLRLAFG